jgi:hypothetical protein
MSYRKNISLYQRFTRLPTILNTSKKPAERYSSSEVLPKDSTYSARPKNSRVNVATKLTRINGVGGTTPLLIPRIISARGRAAAQAGRSPQAMDLTSLVAVRL